ncbi:hypothetical protein [Actinoplanes sp. NPDC049681]|uniref:hypothetical protein n=1 Tax=Actinoplanes sp. NPDC049681 TaxID=3363905 RepID=UPI0037A8490F
MVLGPLSPHHSRVLQQNYELITGAQGVRHLCRFAVREGYTGPVEPNSLCGVVLRERPLPYHKPQEWLTEIQPEEAREEVPHIDLYAEWDRADLCRSCLISALAPEPGSTPSPAPQPARRHWLSRSLRR